MNIKLTSRAIERLIDSTASGIGSTGSLIFSRMIRRETMPIFKLSNAQGEARVKIASELRV